MARKVSLHSHMTNTKKKIAIIGLGGQSRSELIPALLKLKDTCEIVAICDVNQEFIDLSRELLPNKEEVLVFKDYKNVFAHIGQDGFSLDGVVLSVPHFLYAEIIELAVNKGVAVFKEKPFALNLDEAQRLSTLALKEGVQIYTVTKRQFYPSYIMGLEQLQNGIIGPAYMYSARHFIPHGNLYEGWRSSVQAAGGGALIDMGYHLLDVILRYFSDVTQAKLQWTNVGKPNYTYEVEDAASLLNWHPTGVQGVFQVAVLSGPKEESLEIRGTKGRMLITKEEVVIFDVSGQEKDRFTFETDATLAVDAAFEQFLLNDKSIWSQNISHNMKIMRVIDMAYKGRFE